MKCDYKDISEPLDSEEAQYQIKVRPASISGLYYWWAYHLHTEIAYGADLERFTARYHAKRAVKRHCKLQKKAGRHGWKVVPR